MEWVPVKERYPDPKKDGEMVLVYDPGWGVQLDSAIYMRESKEITHWMKLPEKPA